MSSAEEEELAAEVCASCGKAEVDDIKLKKCTACKLVKYCSVDCQKNHWKQHKTACKKRAAEIRDDRLFSQPDDSCLGECPICCLPLPLDRSKSSINSCCGKLICNGCHFANMTREHEQGLEERCPYCRESPPKLEEEAERRMMERVEANDPVALFQMGKRYLARDYDNAFAYLTKAAGLGVADAHFELSRLYYEGDELDKICPGNSVMSGLSQ